MPRQGNPLCTAVNGSVYKPQPLIEPSLYRLTPSSQLKTSGNRSTDDCLQPPSTPSTVAAMGQHSSKVHKNQSSTKSISSLNRVSKLFQPGLKNQRTPSGSNRTSPQPSRGEDAATNRPARGQPEAEGRPAETADDQV